jgi:hypothetical protein
VISIKSNTAKQPAAAPSSWRDVLKIHPAAELLPRMFDDDLRELADDIKRNKLQSRVSVMVMPDGSKLLLDGISRLTAMEGAGLPIIKDGKLDDAFVTYILSSAVPDPYDYVLSANLHRRHLSGEEKRSLIATLLKVKPDASNLAIAKQVKADDKTVAKVRTDLERRSDIPNVKARTDSKGRKQPAKKAKPAPASKPKAARAVSPQDIALLDFTARVADLVQRIAKHEPKRFVGTAVSADDLAKLGKFFADLASLKRGQS